MFWVFLLVGILIFTPYFYFLIKAQVLPWIILYSGIFLAYCYLLYHLVYKKARTKYPIVPPEGRMEDAYFPRTKIPRPLYEDVQRYPEVFKEKKKRKYQRTRRVKKKT